MFSWNLLSRGVKAVFFVQIVNRMGDFVVPFLTLLLTQIQGMSAAQAGLVVTLATALSSLGGLLAARLGDRHSRRDVLVVFLGTSAVLVGAAGFAPADITSAVVLVVAGFFFGAMRPLLGALIADLSTVETRRAAYSLSYLGINLGVSLGPLLAGWLFDHALNWLFWLDALSTAVALGVLVAYVPRKTHEGAPRPPESKAIRPPSALRRFVGHRLLFPFSLLMLAYNFVYAQLVFTLGLTLVERFGKDGPALFGAVWALNGLFVIVLTPLVLRWTRLWTNLAAMAWGMMLIGAGIVVYVFEPELFVVWASTGLWSAGEVLFSVHYGDLVATHSPVDVRARFQAYTGFLTSLGFVVSPVLSGLLAQTLGLSILWAAATALVLLVALGFWRLGRSDRAQVKSSDPAGETLPG